jgi:hypothetical protein
LADQRAHVNAPDTLALIGWTFRDQLIAAVEQEIDKRADDKAALTDEQRAGRLAELSGAILQSERVEVALIEQAGGDVTYRRDTDPRALFGLAGNLPAPDKR